MTGYRRAAIGGAWLLAAMVLVFAAWHRIPWPDEGHFVQPPYYLLSEGKFATKTVDATASGLLRADQRTYWTMPLHSFLMSGWFLVFGVSLFGARMMTVLLLPVLGWQTYRIARLVTRDEATAAWAAVLMPLEYVVLYTSSWARPDVLCAVLGLGGICWYLGRREASLRQALWGASLLVTLSGLAHPNAILHGAGLAFLVLYYDRRRLTAGLLIGMAAAALLAVVPYAAYVSLDWEAFTQQMRRNAEGNDRMAAGWNPVSLVWRELVERYGLAYGQLSPGLLPRLKGVALISYLGAVVAFLASGALRRATSTGPIVALWAIYFAVQCVFNQKLSVYLIHILPLTLILVSSGAVYVWRRNRLAGVSIAAWLALSAVVQTGGFAYVAMNRSAVAGQREAADFLKRNAGPAQRINGSVTLVFPLRFDARLKDDRSLGLNSGIAPEVIVVEESYRESFEGYKTRRPELLARILRRLEEYRLSYDRGGYQIYFRPDFKPGSALQRPQE
ncbi:MAG TPA: hypothetical protein DEH78_06140 [Solibacterales bacterium]|nr:hypothetical protein [Bryobacterales bacterium]